MWRTSTAQSASRPGGRLGRAGQGPGEFVSIAGLGPTDDGGLVIVDGRQLRASRMDAEGEFVASWQLRPPQLLGNASSGPILMAGDGRLRMVWSAGVIRVDGGRPRRLTLITRPVNMLS